MIPEDRFAGRAKYDLTLADHDYPARDSAPHRKILICAHPRSGSTLLAEALYFAGGLGCPLEYYHDGFMPDLARRWRTPDLKSYARAVHRHRTDPSGVFSAKLFWRDIGTFVAHRDPALGAALRDAPDPAVYRAAADLLDDILRDAAYVHLVRRDRVRLAVSALLTEQTAVWRRIPGIDDHAPLAEPSYDFARITSLIADAAQAEAHWLGFFAAIGVRPLTLTYEALARDYATVTRQVLATLGRDVAPPQIRLEQQYTAKSEAMVLRYLREEQQRQATARD